MICLCLLGLMRTRVVLIFQKCEGSIVLATTEKTVDCDQTFDQLSGDLLGEIIIMSEWFLSVGKYK